VTSIIHWAVAGRIVR